MMAPQLLLLFMALRASAYPSYIDCTGAIIGGSKNDVLGESMLATTKNIMGAAPIDVNDVFVVQPTVCAGKTVSIELFSSPTSGHGLFHASDGEIQNGGGSPRTGCTGTNVMSEYTVGMTGITWKAPASTGPVIFRAMYAGTYGAVQRAQHTINVIADDPNNQACVASPTQSPNSTPEASVGSECSQYENNKNIGSGFKLCWTLKSASTDIMVTNLETTSDQWIGAGIGVDMVSSSVVIGYSDNGASTTTTLKPSSKSDMAWQENNNNGLGFINLGYKSENGENLVKFTVPSAEPEIELVAAFGPMTVNPQEPFGLHTKRRAVTQNLLTGTTVAKSLPPTLIAHAVLMVLGWGLLLPAGFLMARYGKEKWPPVEGGSKLGWFEYHKYIQVVGLLLVTIAFAIGLAEGSKTNYPHMSIGIVVSVLGIWQPINAKFRPHKKKGKVQEPRRVYWEYLHKGSGYIAILLGFVNIGLGLAIALNQY